MRFAVVWCSGFDSGGDEWNWSVLLSVSFLFFLYPVNLILLYVHLRLYSVWMVWEICGRKIGSVKGERANFDEMILNNINKISRERQKKIEQLEQKTLMSYHDTRISNIDSLPSSSISQAVLYLHPSLFQHVVCDIQS